MDKDKDKSLVEGGQDVVSGVFHKYRSEFRKIVWPSKETLLKHTITVVIVSAIFGAYIAINDGVFGFLFRQFVNLVGGA
ncbi:MAG: preprotein translocase subunit SecE [Defluviitaleaceae bacterium]|nr:preprotein translocase subunit SecE [Defluviitaleaceae bacterium]